MVTRERGPAGNAGYPLWALWGLQGGEIFLGIGAGGGIFKRVGVSAGWFWMVSERCPGFGVPAGRSEDLVACSSESEVPRLTVLAGGGGVSGSSGPRFGIWGVLRSGVRGSGVLSLESRSRVSEGLRVQVMGWWPQIWGSGVGLRSGVPGLQVIWVQGPQVSRHGVRGPQLLGSQVRVGGPQGPPADSPVVAPACQQGVGIGIQRGCGVLPGQPRGLRVE